MVRGDEQGRSSMGGMEPPAFMLWMEDIRKGITVAMVSRALNDRREH